MAKPQSHSSKIAYISHPLMSIVFLIALVQLISLGLIIQHSWQSYRQAQHLALLNNINHDLYQASDQLERESALSQTLLSGSQQISAAQHSQLSALRQRGDDSMARALQQIDHNDTTLAPVMREQLASSWRHFQQLRGDSDNYLASRNPQPYETLVFQISLASADLEDHTNLAVHELTRKLGTAPDETIGRLAEASYLLWQIHTQVAADGSAMILRAKMEHLLNSSDEAALEIRREYADIVMEQLQTELRFLDRNALGYHASELAAEVDNFLDLSSQQLSLLRQTRPSPYASNYYRQQAGLTQDHLMALFDHLSDTAIRQVRANSQEAHLQLVHYSLMLLLALTLNLALLIWLRIRVLRPLRQLSTIQNAAREAILLADASGRIITSNAGAEILFGLTARQLLSLRVEQLLPEMPVSTQQLRLWADSGEEIRGMARLSDNSRKPIGMIANLLPGDQGQGGMLLIIRDDSARHAAEQANQQTLFMLSEITRIQDLVFTQSSRQQVFRELQDMLLASTHSDGACLLEIREEQDLQRFRCRASHGLEQLEQSEDCSDSLVQTLYQRLKNHPQWTFYPVALQNRLNGLIGLRNPQQDTLQRVMDPLLSLYASVLGFITEEESRKQSTAQLNEVLREQEALFSASPAGLIQIDSDARIVRTNQHACQIFGVGEDSVLNLRLDQLLNTPAAWSRLEQRITHVRSGMHVASCELECQNHAGDMVWVLFELKALHAEQPQQGMILSCIDISTLKQTEKALRAAHDIAAQARGQLVAAIEAIPEAFAFYNEIDDLVICNQQYANMFSPNLTPEQMIGRSFEESVRYSVAERNEAMEGGFDIDSWVQERLRRHHIEETNFQLHIDDQWFLSSNHRVPGVGNVCLRANITGLKAQEQELRQAKVKADDANRAKSAFLASISHEIRTPLNGILGLLELLHLTALDHSQQDTLASVQESAQTLLRLIDDILDFSKIEAGKLELMPEPMAIPPLLYKVRDLYGEMAGKKNLQFLLEIDPSLAPGHLADPLRLRQILQNFVSNAIKFTSQGKITLKLTVLAADEQQQTLCFSCSDTGIGISPDSLSILFQPFTQAESSTTRRFGGTGLGLAICKRLGDQMGGAVELDSQQYGGTTARLTVTLPRANFIPLEAEPEPAAPLAAPEHPVHAQMAPILFVEDNPTNRKLTMMQLDRIGVPYHVAENGQQAFDMWMQQPYSLVLTDCHMPIMDGHQLARAIRSSEAEIPGLPAVPIIACTANIGKDEADRAMAAGMNEVLTKPIGLEPLRKTLNAWLQQSQINETATAPAAAEPQNAEIIDRETLKIYSQGDLSIELGILQDFLSSEMEDREALRKAVSGQNHKDARWSTHRIKGAGRMVGALPLARAAENLEQCAKQQGAMDQALQTLEQAFEAVALWVETHTSDTTPI